MKNMIRKKLLKSIAINLLFLIAGGIISGTIVFKRNEDKVAFANKFQTIIKNEKPDLLRIKIDFANSFQEPLKASKVETRTIYNDGLVNGKMVVTDSVAILSKVIIDLANVDTKAIDKYIWPIYKHTIK